MKVKIVVAVILWAIILCMAVPMAVEMRERPCETSALSSLRMLCSVQEQYRQTMTGGKRYCNSLADLSTLEYIDGVLGVGRKSGYMFTLSTDTMSSDGYIHHWNCHANPVKYDKTGKQYYYVDQTGIPRFCMTGTANEISKKRGWKERKTDIEYGFYAGLNITAGYWIIAFILLIAPHFTEKQ